MVSDVLKKLRMQNNLTQKQVAEILKIDRSTYAYYETGRTVPDMYTLSVISRIYNITPEQIMSLCYGRNSEFFVDDAKIRLNSEVKKPYYDSDPERYLSELNRDEQLLILYYRQIKGKADALEYIRRRCFDDLEKDKKLFCGDIFDE